MHLLRIMYAYGDFYGVPLVTIDIYSKSDKTPTCPHKYFFIIPSVFLLFTVFFYFYDRHVSMYITYYRPFSLLAKFNTNTAYKKAKILYDSTINKDNNPVS